MLATELFYITLGHYFIGYYFEYLPLSPLQVCVVSLAGFKDIKEYWSMLLHHSDSKRYIYLMESLRIIYRFNNSRRQIAVNEGHTLSYHP